jgi:hypothetical protein
MIWMPQACALKWRQGNPLAFSAGLHLPLIGGLSNMRISRIIVEKEGNIGAV